jgi:hypothetical protein
MIFVTFISIHFVIICNVLLWRTYETHPALSLKFGCDITPYVATQGLHTGPWRSTSRDAHHIEVLEEVRHCLRQLPQLGPLLLHGPGQGQRGLGCDL